MGGPRCLAWLVSPLRCEWDCGTPKSWRPSVIFLEHMHGGLIGYGDVSLLVQTWVIPPHAGPFP